MEPIIYFRDIGGMQEELEAAKKYFKVVSKRTDVLTGAKPMQLVIPRYSALPYNKELCEDLQALNACPINSHAQHRYVADIGNWYPDLEGMTPKTWFNFDHIPASEKGPFVLKGATNSKKFQWRTHMYAEDLAAAREVYWRLLQDSLIGTQHIVIRKYETLYPLGKDVSGMPISEEYRFFVYGSAIVDSAFYWSQHTERLQEQGILVDPSRVPTTFIKDVIHKVGSSCDFYTVDIAKKLCLEHPGASEWTVIELNDGQMSGLSDIPPDRFYKNLKERIYPHDL